MRTRFMVGDDMEIIQIELGKTIQLAQPIAACIGYFDGFHAGHQALFQATLQAAKQKGLKSAIITFDPDPWVVIKGIQNIKHLSSLQDRALWALQDGFDYMIIMQFTKDLAAQPPEDFIKQMLFPLGIQHLVCGFDFHFGARGKGNVAMLQQYESASFQVEEIKEVLYNNDKISSTRISKEVEAGNMQLVTKLLSRPYQMQGVVIPGRQQGRRIGFPTANIDLSDNYILPKQGVYVGEVIYDEQVYMGMVNVGYNLTFNTREDLSLEVNILDFHKMIYGERVVLRFLHYLREELKFANIEELIEQLKVDEADTRKYFEERR